MGLSHLSYMGQVGWDGHIELSVLMGQVIFHRTVPLVLHGRGGIGRTYRIEGVGGTARIP